MTAALELKRAGHSVVLLEARKRVGGRVVGHELANGEISERGGTFVGPTQDRILAALKRHGLKTFPTFNEGENVYVNGGERSTFSDTGPTGSAPNDPLILPELATVVAKLDQMSTKVPVDAPWTAAKAADWDSQTLQTYINANTGTDGFRKVVPLATRPIFGAEPRELSLLFTLFYIASSGNEKNPGTFERNFNTRDGAQESRFVGGSQVIAFKIAADLKGRIFLRSPVRRIEQHKSGVTVVSDRVTVKAKQVVVAIPPTLAGRIEYAPGLPFQRDQFTQRDGMGSLT
jgi:monoamine oxidase